MRSLILFMAVTAFTGMVGGCAVFHAGAVLAQSFEDQKLIEVLPKYDGLVGKDTAVIVSLPMDVRYQHPGKDCRN